MLQVDIRISGTPEIQTKLTKLGRELYMLPAAMESIGKGAAAYYGNVAFASQGGVFGSVWPRLNPQYALRKSKKYIGNVGPLIATGAMKDSFTYEATPTGVTIENTAEYFKYHQSSAPRHRLPRRKMMAINPAIMEIVAFSIKSEITNKINAVQL